MKWDIPHTAANLMRTGRHLEYRHHPKPTRFVLPKTASPPKLALGRRKPDRRLKSRGHAGTPTRGERHHAILRLIQVNVKRAGKRYQQLENKTVGGAFSACCKKLLYNIMSMSIPKHPIDKLLQEHANMQRVLFAFHSQLRVLEQNRTPDLILMFDTLYYMRRFPSVMHHPKEGVIFEQVLEAGAPLRNEVERLYKQHHDLYALEESLIELVVELEVQAGKRDYAPALVELGHHYLDIQIQHMETEELFMFPKALEYLKPQGWDNIREHYDHIDDPLFSRHPAGRFQYLYDYLLRGQ